MKTTVASKGRVCLTAGCFIPVIVNLVLYNNFVSITVFYSISYILWSSPRSCTVYFTLFLCGHGICTWVFSNSQWTVVNCLQKKSSGKWQSILALIALDSPKGWSFFYFKRKAYWERCIDCRRWPQGNSICVNFWTAERDVNVAASTHFGVWRKERQKSRKWNWKG